MVALEDSPSGTSDDTTVRASVTIGLEPSNRFRLPKKRRYAPQYAQIYFCRLMALRPILEKSAHATFGPPTSTLHYPTRIVDVSSLSKSDQETPSEAVIMGVIFREMSKKPSILSLYEQASHELIPPPPNRSTTPYPGDKDTVHLEDENGRCTLDISQFNPLPDAFVTGFVVALRGREDRTTGAFRVTAFASTLPAPQKSIKTLPADRYVCVVSGLSLTPTSLPTELLLEFLRGNSGDEREEEFAANVVQLIIAGDLVPPAKAPAGHRPMAVGEKEKVASPMEVADRFLSGVASALPTYYMPGGNDPANVLLPQQPLHRCLLPSSSRNTNLCRVPNPFECSVEGRLLLATSGQNVTDFSLYETEKRTEGDGENAEMKENKGDGKSFEPSGSRALDIMEAMLNNRHIAPTCPDTLGSYPFYEQDPFVVKQTPHVFVVGNQKEYASRLMRVPLEGTQSTDDQMDVENSEAVRGVRLISVPRFDRTGQAVFVNLRNMECTVREFALMM